MLATAPFPNRRLVLECRYDGPIPPRYRAGADGTAAPALRLGSVVAALARRRRRLAAQAAAGDPALARMSRYLTQAVRAERLRE